MIVESSLTPWFRTVLWLSNDKTERRVDVVGRALPHPNREDIDLVTVLHALADPVRLAVLAKLASGEGASCATAGQDTDVAASTLSHHYRVLREAGLVMTTVEGRHRRMRLRGDDLEARFPGLLHSVLAGARPA
jgi:DNA-binding transcriptional ArsR family regulator